MTPAVSGRTEPGAATASSPADTDAETDDASVPPGTTGVVARLDPTQSAWMRALPTRAGARRRLHLALLCALLCGALLLPQSLALARALHVLVIERQDWTAVAPTLALAASLLLLRALLIWISELAARQAAEQVKHRVRMALFRRFLHAGVLWSRARASGELAEALGPRLEALDGYLAQYLPALAQAALLPLGFCLVLLGHDLTAAVILLLTLPLIPLFMALVGWGAEAAGQRHAQALARLSGLFADRVRGLSTLKLFGAAGREAERVARASDEVRARSLAVLKLAFLSSAVLEFFAALGVAGLALYFGLSFLELLDLRSSPLTLETALFCLLLAPEVYLPLRRLAAHHHDRAQARAAVMEIAALFDGLPALTDVPAPDAARPPDEAQAGTVSNASPAPLPAPGEALLQLDALRLPLPGRAPLRLASPTCIRQGDWIALTGPSGSGKSSLLETLAGLRPCEGRIQLAGRLLSEWPSAALRAQLLLISQRPWLLPGTLAENLRLACPAATDEALQHALAAVGLDAWLARRPQGLETRLGMRGQGLSGGQMQRLALARMFLSEAPLLLLDEPTAHLDAATAARVIAAITRLARGRTLILATHDPALAALASRHWPITPNGVIHND